MELNGYNTFQDFTEIVNAFESPQGIAVQLHEFLHIMQVIRNSTVMSSSQAGYMNVVCLLTATLQLEMRRCIYFHSRTLKVFFRILLHIKIKVKKIHNSAQSNLCI